MFGLVTEQHNSDPAADAATQPGHPQKRPLRDSKPLFLCFLFVNAIKDESQNIDYQEVATNDNGLLRHRKVQYSPRPPGRKISVFSRNLNRTGKKKPTLTG